MFKVAASFICEARLKGEIIVVDDGSTDNTAEAARGVKIPSSVRRVVIRLDKNSGKGMAVKTGVKETQGDREKRTLLIFVHESRLLDWNAPLATMILFK